MSKTQFILEPGKQEIVMTRTFNAPRQRVFKAYTDPTLIPQWWGPRRLTTTVETMEVKKGGVWRYVQHDAGRNEFAFNGVYHEISPPERLINTFEFEGMPGNVGLVITTFEERGGQTILSEKSVFPSVEDRDRVSSGMEGGAIETLDRFEELLATLQLK
jgi:uncharacterized protein YndB with AHSA1/START domain